MKTRLIITLTALLMLTGISANAQSSIQTPSTSSIIGDLNGDNKANAADVVILVNYIKNMFLNGNTDLSDGTLFVKKDINKDGIVNNTDVDALINIIMDNDNPTFAAIDISGYTENADLLFLCSNGDYILYDGENKDGYTLININNVANEEITDGITLFINKAGDPVMASSSEGHLLFFNVNDDKFDYAFINNQNDMSQYENVNYKYKIPSVSATRGILDPIYNYVFDGKDEYSKKALTLYFYKCLSLLISGGFALTGSYAGLFLEIYKVVDKHAYDSKIFKIIEGSSSVSTDISALFNFKGMPPISTLGLALGKYADDEIEKMGTFIPYVAPHFNGEDWQIKLEKQVLQCPPEEGWYSINIDSKAFWQIDRSKFDESWCDISHQVQDQVVIHVRENCELSDRNCYLFFYSPFTDEILHSMLTIRQEGCSFNVSEKVVVLNTIHSSEMIYCEPIGTSYEITHCPKWCKYKKYSNGFKIEVDLPIEIEREEMLIVSASVGDKTIERSILIKQVPMCPDSNHPHAIDLSLPSGTKWACCNVGASMPEQHGGLYAWGEIEEKSDYILDNYKWNDGGKWCTFTKYCTNEYNGKVDNKTVIDNSDDVAYVKWGSSWRMPTKEQLQELVNNCASTWDTYNGMEGRFFTGSNDNIIFLPAAGYKDATGLRDKNEYGYYWSNSLNLDDNDFVYELYFCCGKGINLGKEGRWEGCSVRPVVSMTDSVSTGSMGH